MNNSNEKHYIDGTLTMIIFGIFAACIVLALLSGAGVYKRLSSRDLESYNWRTCLQYLSTKLRTADSPDSVSIGFLDDTKALILRENINGENFDTYIYSYDGWLMELYCLEGVNAGPDAGEKLMETGNIDFSYKNGLVEITLEDTNGYPKNLLLSIRGREETVA